MAAEDYTCAQYFFIVLQLHKHVVNMVFKGWGEKRTLLDDVDQGGR